MQIKVNNQDYKTVMNEDGTFSAAAFFNMARNEAKPFVKP